MGLLSRILGRNEAQHSQEDVACPHTALTPRWENLEDMGKQERAVGFHCESCGTDFSGDEGRRLLH